MTGPIEVLQSEAAECARCHGELLLHSNGQNRAYPVFQRNTPWPVRVLVVAEAPNFDDSFNSAKRRLTLEPGTDPSGEFMFDLLTSVGLGADQVLFTNSVLCLPAQNSEGKHSVSARQQDLCSEWLGRFIDVANPAVVVTFGAVALQGVGRLERHGLSLSEGVGKLHPWRGRHLLPLYHPSRLGRVTRPADKQLEDISALREALAAMPPLDAATAKEVMRAHPAGARLVLRSRAGEVFGDTACCIGLQWGRSPVFAYLVSGEGPPFALDTRFFVEGVSLRGGVWVIECRDERGICEVELHPLAVEEHAATQGWLSSLSEDAIKDLEGSMRQMLDERSL